MFRELLQKILSLAGLGSVGVGDDSGPVQVLQVKLGPNDTPDLPRLPQYGFTSMPPPDTDAIVIFFGGDRSNGAIIASSSKAFRLRNLKSGESALYDNLGQKIYLSQSGIVVEGASLPISVTSTASVTITAPVVTVVASTKVELQTPLLKVDGAIQATGDITDNAGTNTKTMANMRTVYDSHNHSVPNVQGGLSTLPTSTPTPTI